MSFSVSGSGHVVVPASPAADASDEQVKEFQDAQAAAVALEQEIYDTLAAAFQKYQDDDRISGLTASFYGSHIQGTLLSVRAPNTNEDGSLTEEGRAEVAAANAGLAN